MPSTAQDHRGVAVQQSPDARLATARALYAAASGTTLPLDLEGSEHARNQRDSLVRQLEDYLIPRLQSPDAPLLAVVGGSSGAGKSTLVNSICGESLTPSGTLRPTTRSPVLVHHRDDAQWFADDRILPSLSRVTEMDTAVRVDGIRPSGLLSSSGDVPPPGQITSIRLATSEALPPGLALIDAPDVDSVVQANRGLAQQLFAAADLWIFVTTPARYGDAIPWEHLRRAADRGASVVVVLNRAHPQVLDQTRRHLASMLCENGLSSAALFTVAEEPVGSDGFLHRSASQPLRSWLMTLAGSAQVRRVVMQRTLAGVMADVEQHTRTLAVSVAAQDAARRVLVDAVAVNYAAAGSRTGDQLRSGSLARGEVATRWQEYVEVAESQQPQESDRQRSRHHVHDDESDQEFSRRVHHRQESSAQAPPQSTSDQLPGPQKERLEQISQALKAGVESLVLAAAHRAADQTARQWRDTSYGVALMSEFPQLATADPQVARSTGRAVAAWEGHLRGLISTAANTQEIAERMAPYGVDGVVVLLMMVILGCADDSGQPAVGDLPDDDVGAAGNALPQARHLLLATLGHQMAQVLVEKGQADLLSRVDDLLAVDWDRYEMILDQFDVGTHRETLDRIAADWDGLS